MAENNMGFPGVISPYKWSYGPLLIAARGPPRLVCYVTTYVWATNGHDMLVGKTDAKNGD